MALVPIYYVDSVDKRPPLQSTRKRLCDVDPCGH